MFDLGLLHVKRPPDCDQLPLVIESDRPFCLARPETTLHDTPADQTRAHCLESVLYDEPESLRAFTARLDCAYWVSAY